jgi:hypothetical protein
VLLAPPRPTQNAEYPSLERFETDGTVQEPVTRRNGVPPEASAT